MKRDLDYLRDFLLECEKNEEFRFAYEESTYLEGAVREVLPVGWTVKKQFHYELLKDAGFVVEIDHDFSPPRDGNSATLSVRKFRLTNSGCDYLESVRDDKIWKKTSKKLLEVGGSATLEIVKSVATGLVKSTLGI